MNIKQQKFPIFKMNEANHLQTDRESVQQPNQAAAAAEKVVPGRQGWSENFCREDMSFENHNEATDQDIAYGRHGCSYWVSKLDLPYWNSSNKQHKTCHDDHGSFLFLLINLQNLLALDFPLLLPEKEKKRKKKGKLKFEMEIHLQRIRKRRWTCNVWLIYEPRRKSIL